MSAFKYYTPIDNASTWLVNPYQIGQTGITVADVSPFGNPTSGNPTLCTIVNGNEELGNATYLQREIIGISPGNNMQLGAILGGTIDQNIQVNSPVQRRIVSTDFQLVNDQLKIVGLSGAFINLANTFSLPQTMIVQDKGGEVYNVLSFGAKADQTTLLASGISTSSPNILVGTYIKNNDD